MNKHNEIIDYIETRRRYVVDFIKKLISFDSQFNNFGEYGNEFNIQKYIESKLKEIGANEVIVFEPDNAKLEKYGSHYFGGHNYKKRQNVVGVFNFSKNGRTIILNGHVDTVNPAGGEEAWTYNPWNAVEKDGKIYGLGATDMKSGLANFVLCVEFLKDLDLLNKGSIIIESVVDEEGGGNGTLACIEKGYSADIGIIAEPTNLEIHVAHRGVQILEIEVQGFSVHAAYKWKGINAIEKTIKIISGLSELEKKWLAIKKPRYVPRPTISVTEINSGIGATTIPNKCISKFDIKFTNDDLDEVFSPSRIREEISSYIYRICKGDDWLSKHKPVLRWLENVSAYENKEISLFNDFIDNSKKIIGSSIISGSPYGSDARLLGHIGKIPTILFGPGGFGSEGSGLCGPHSVDESILIDQVIAHLKILCVSVYDFLRK